ncbi:MAG: phosphotransferase, partial [bacterium]
YHAGPAFEGSFSPFRAIDEYLHTARRFGAPLPADVDALRSRVGEIGAALGSERTILRPCHNDLWWENLIDDGRQISIVDWEYAAMGDACFDLAYFAMHHCPSDAHDETLIQAYFGQVPEDARTRFKLLKIAAELREALWYVVAIYVASANTGFPHSARIHFDRCRRALADPRVRDWVDHATRG